MLTRKFYFIILITLTYIFSTGCSDDDPTVFGNDGATLNNLNIGDALALISNSSGPRITDSEGMIFPEMKLYTLSKGGALAELPINFSGDPNGGTNHYILYDINERYSILSFFSRKESYIIDQTNGDVHKSIYIGQPEHCVAGTTELYFSDLYSLNTGGVYRKVKVLNFLSPEAELVVLPDDFETFILDKNDNLYSYGSGSPFDVYHYGNGSKTKITSGVAVFNDHNNILRVVSMDGDISSLNDGSTQTGVSLKEVSLSSSVFQAFPFPKQQKTLAVLRNNISHYIMLYDVSRGENKLNISTLDKSNFNFIAASAINNYLFLLGSVLDGELLVRIDVTDYSYTKVLFDNSASLFRGEFLTALSDTELLTKICEPVASPPTSCQPSLIYFDMSGNVKTLLDGFDSQGEVVRLSDN